MADEQSAAATVEEPPVEVAPRQAAQKEKKPKRAAALQRHALERRRPHLRLRDHDDAKTVRPSGGKRNANRQAKSTLKARPSC